MSRFYVMLEVEMNRLEKMWGTPFYVTTLTTNVTIT